MQKCCLVMLSLFLCTGISSCVNSPCQDTNGCLPGLYCKKDTGNCESGGVCAEKPQNCIEIYSPVCGCDGKTYSNGCCAAMYGMNADYEGECTSDCADNLDCPDASYYCKKHPGFCDGGGMCTGKPEVCPEYYAPVCGCNGTTYSNPCDAASVGVNVLHMGAC